MSYETNSFRCKAPDIPTDMITNPDAYIDLRNDLKEFASDELGPVNTIGFAHFYSGFKIYTVASEVKEGVYECRSTSDTFVSGNCNNKNVGGINYCVFGFTLKDVDTLHYIGSNKNPDITCFDALVKRIESKEVNGVNAISDINVVIFRETEKPDECEDVYLSYIWFLGNTMCNVARLPSDCSPTVYYEINTDMAKKYCPKLLDYTRAKIDSGKTDASGRLSGHDNIM